MAHGTTGPVIGRRVVRTAVVPDESMPPRAAPIDLAPSDHRRRWRPARLVFVGSSWLLVAGLVVQVFLAGLGVFDTPERFELHSSLGFTLQVLPFLMLVSGLAGGLGRRQVGLAGLIFALFFVQSLLVSVRDDAPMIAALHPLNGFGILLLSIVVARAARLTAPRGSTDGIG